MFGGLCPPYGDYMSGRWLAVVLTLARLVNRGVAARFGPMSQHTNTHTQTYTMVVSFKFVNTVIGEGRIDPVL